MGLFKNFFGKSDPLASVRRAVEQKNWADALALGEKINKSELIPEIREELEHLLVKAGDKLAELNLSEGEACLRAGDSARAREHFSLAFSLARSAELKERAANVHTNDKDAGQNSSLPNTQSSCCSTCFSSPVTPESNTSEVEDLDSQTRMDLILATYPSELAKRYEQMSEMFKEAFLLSHNGDDRQALKILEKIPAEQYNDLFYFERASLWNRLGNAEKAIDDLEKAVELNSEHVLAMEALVQLEIACGQESRAENRLVGLMQSNILPAFSSGCLAFVCARQGKTDEALEYARKSMHLGNKESDLLFLTATLLEKKGHLEEAESLLFKLSSGGCSSVNIPLAEFWLRNRKNLDKALENFKGALRQDPGNPNWSFRISQVYIARGWKKEGLAVLEKVLNDPRLDPALREEGNALLDTF